MLTLRKIGSFSSLSGNNSLIPSKFDPTTPSTLPPLPASASRKLSTLCSTARVTVYRRWTAQASAARRPPLFGTIVPARMQSPHQFTDVFVVKWSEEPVQMQIDVKTGHLILSYMEERLRNRDRLDADWAAISSYESEEAVPCEAASKPENVCKNRYGCPVPYEQTRVMLSNRGNVYINASLVFDHDPRTPTYIAAETPLPGTVAAFWQMVWEQFAVVIVCLEPESALEQSSEDCLGSGHDSPDTTTQARYWPPEGSSVYGKFEVRFVSEHSSSGNFVIRSFYLKEVDSGETRTITQFHFLKWLEDVPSCEVKTLLDFRRKVNKSFRAKKSPVVVHCIDGSGKTGTYLLIDLVLNRINKGVKELDVAASIEHLRDQRQGMIKSKEQFQFVLASIAEEVNSMLNAVG